LTIRRSVLNPTTVNGPPKADCATDLDLDEHKRGSVSRHDVDLAKPSAISTCENYIPASKELLASDVLALLTE